MASFSFNGTREGLTFIRVYSFSGSVYVAFSLRPEVLDFMAEKSPAPMATPATRSEEAPRNSSKPRKKNEVPPPELLSKPVDICSHCNKKCKSKGVG